MKDSYAVPGFQDPMEAPCARMILVDAPRPRDLSREKYIMVRVLTHRWMKNNETSPQGKTPMVLKAMLLNLVSVDDELDEFITASKLVS
jgi:hypothetical protein